MLVHFILVLLTDSRIILQPNFYISKPLKPLSFSNSTGPGANREKQTIVEM